MDPQAVITKALELMFDAGAPVWITLAVVVVCAVLLVVGPKIRLPSVKVESAPVVDEGGVQHEGTPLPTDPNREDLDSGGSG